MPFPKTCAGTWGRCGKNPLSMSIEYHFPFQRQSCFQNSYFMRENFSSSQLNQPFPVFSSSILSDFIALTPYILHHEHRRTSYCRLRASRKRQEAAQAGDRINNRQPTPHPQIPTQALPVSLRCHVRRVHRYFSVPLLRFLRHPSRKHPSGTSDVHHRCPGFQSSPTPVHQPVLRLLSGRQCLGIFPHLRRSLQSCRHAGNVSRRSIALYTRCASHGVTNPRCHFSGRSRQRAVSRTTGRPDRFEDRHIHHPGSLHRDVPHRRASLHHLHARGRETQGNLHSTSRHWLVIIHC